MTYIDDSQRPLYHLSKKGGQCTAPCCGRRSFCKRLCFTHYHRASKGIPLITENERFVAQNPPVNGVAKIPLSRGLYTIVDESDYRDLVKRKWCATFGGGKSKDEQKYYAVTSINGKQVTLHRFLLGCKRGEIGDHINGDTLDNRRSNLRKCDFAGNSQNSRRSSKFKERTSSQYKGVSWSEKAHKWMAQIRFRKRAYYLNYYEHEEDAAIAYDVAAQILFGEFASTNFPCQQTLLPKP